MKPKGIIINTARGGIVDSVTLVNALKNGRIAGAGIDVLTEEPPQVLSRYCNPHYFNYHSTLPT